MRALLLHTNRFESRLVEKSTRPQGIQPELQRSTIERMENCLTVLVCIEKMDSDRHIDALYNEVVEAAKQMKVPNIMAAPFVHLSKNVAPPTRAKELFDQFVQRLAEQHFTVGSSHFGYHKEQLLDIKGHRLAYKYREFV